MSLNYSVDSDRRIVIISGDFTSPSEWVLLASRLLRDPAVTSNFVFLRDLRGVKQTHSPATVLAVFRIVRRFWPTFRPIKGAIVTDRGENYAAQVAQALADTDDLPIRVFTDFDEALEWAIPEESGRIWRQSRRDE
jgi:hypothetical protein